MIAELLPKIAAELGAIEKTDRNDHSGYMYRGVDAALQALHPVLVKHGVNMRPRVLDVRTEVRQSAKGKPVNWCFLTVEYVFTAADGSELSCVVVGESADSQDKSSGQAMSQALKAAVFQTFTVPTGDPDPDSKDPFGNPNDGDYGRRPQSSSAGRRPDGHQRRARNNEPAQPPPQQGGDGPSDKQVKLIGAKANNIGLDDDDARYGFMSSVVGRPIGSTKDLVGRGKNTETSRVIDALIAVENGEATLAYRDDGTPFPDWGQGADDYDPEDERPF